MKRYYTDITEDNQQMMLSMLSVAYFADSLGNLALETDALKTTAVNYNYRFTELINGNAMILATSVSGKSMYTKQENMELFLRFPQAHFYLVDPENEYLLLVDELGGIVVDIPVESRTYLNPLEYKP